ncbi:STAS domain-containing protein [Domibacillus sp. PGB-M46]|uniref:STAS domain-containing protein n=1 Tax=Domibacillus sp. PGB-M46 TaxID=2910255 RepID=UPI001F590A1A|nr:STAS domain-containing protein [Domibacillus sp. PGB-M46]MCI2256045.1 STAS domain-containing protein [Domibacillus sp. PGB-M46]
MLTIEKEVQNVTAILKIKGLIDITTTNIIDLYMEDIGNVETVLIDFSSLEFIDSTGIGSIMNAIYLSKEKNFKLKLQGIDEITNEVFETVGLYDILEAFDGEVI